MDAATLATAMACPRSRADRYVDAMNTALVQAGCTTVNRAAGFLSQVGHETLGLHYQEEIASGAAYNGRKDLNNTQPGDGPRYKGRGWIQLTGRGLRNPPSGYTGFSAWCHAKGLVDRADYFVQNPAKVAEPPWSGLAASWYWTVARTKLNSYCDAGDILSISRAVNGWVKVPNGYADRVARWNRARNLGNRILPDIRAVPVTRPSAPPPLPEPELTRRRSEDAEMYIETPKPPDGAAKIDWPRKRFVYGFDPIGGWNGKCILRVNFGPAGGWLHLARWWIRLPDWTPNNRHRMKFWDHPIGAKGTDFAIAADWQTAPPVGASSIELDLSAPDGVHIFMPTEK